MRFLRLAICLLLGCFLLPLAAAAASYDTYTYTYEGEPVLSPHAYLPSQVAYFDKDGIGGLSEPSDIVAGSDGRVYIADTGNSRIVVADSEMRAVAVIDSFTAPGGAADGFNRPQGLFVTADGTLYITDTGNNRVVILRTDGTCVGIVAQLSDPLLPEGFVFSPTALAVDTLGRMYVLSDNTTMGVMAFDRNLVFEGFFGPQKVLPSNISFLRRLLMTEEQRERILQSVPTTYSNITADKDNFLFVTNKSIPLGYIVGAVQMRSSDSAYAVVKRLNPAGEDILLRNGAFPPVGDVKINLDSRGEDYGASAIGDVAVNEAGYYTLLDTKRNKLFTYDHEGALLYAFGGSGSSIGEFQQAVSIAYLGTDILVLDKTMGSVTRFTQTPYGALLDTALRKESEEQYDDSVELWSRVLDINGNLDMAYTRLAEAYYREGDFKKAMELYRDGHNVNGYAKAFDHYKQEIIKKWFLLIALAVAAVVAAFVLLFQRVGAVNRVAAMRRGPYTLRERMAYNFHVCLHPFEGFGEIRANKRADVGSATIMLLLCMASVAGGVLTQGYVVRGGEQGVGLVSSLLVVLVPLVLFTAANWCLTCLMDGEGSAANIYITACYSLLPITLTSLPLGLISNLIGGRDLGFYRFMSAIPIVVALFLLYCGTIVIHNYGAVRNILVFVMTAAGMIILTFIATLLLELGQQMWGLVTDIWREISLRL